MCSLDVFTYFNKPLISSELCLNWAILIDSLTCINKLLTSLEFSVSPLINVYPFKTTGQEAALSMLALNLPRKCLFCSLNHPMYSGSPALVPSGYSKWPQELQTCHVHSQCEDDEAVFLRPTLCPKLRVNWACTASKHGWDIPGTWLSNPPHHAPNPLFAQKLLQLMQLSIDTWAVFLLDVLCHLPT